jgi:Carboxypeptidase regulatory-like domain
MGLRALHGYRAVTMALLCVVAIASAVISVSACRQGVPVVDPSERPTTMDGTISGTVRGPVGTSSIAGRQVEVIDVDSGQRQRATTNSAGGFTFKVKPGKYRVEVTLLEGESVLKGPGIMHVNRSDVDAHADFIIGSGKSESGSVARPRMSPGQNESGLGPPIA